MSPRFARPDPAELPAMLAEAREMYDGAVAEQAAGRSKAAASLAVNAAIRASDYVCAAELGYHSAAASHTAAIDVLGQVADADPLVDALSGALSLKSLFNYQHGPVDETSVQDVIDNARTLLNAASERAERGSEETEGTHATTDEGGES